MKESRDYGDSRCPKADSFIEEHREEWKSQSQRALPDTSEQEEVDTDEEDEVDEDEGEIWTPTKLKRSLPTKPR